MEEAIDIALENNTALKTAQQALRGSQYRVKKSKFNLLPQIDLNFGYSKLDAGTVRRGNVFVGPGRFLVENFSDGDTNDTK